MVVLHPVALTARRSWWSRVKRGVADAIMESSVLRTLCCLSDNEVAAYKQDCDVRAEIRESYRAHLGFGKQATCVQQVMHEVYQETGYDLSSYADAEPKCTQVRRTMQEWDQLFTRLKLDPLKLTKPQLQFMEAEMGVVSVKPRATVAETCVVPKFAAAMCLMLRSKLGRLATNEANILLVEREYLRVARNLRVRDVDIVMHQQYVLNAVFGDDFTGTALARRRMPRWLVALHGEQGLHGGLQVC